jgi:hypothetical protein
MQKVNEIIMVLIVELYNLAILAGTAYLIVQYDWSPWWFLLSVLLLGNYKSVEKRSE